MAFQTATPPLARALAERNYDKPTPVQVAVLADEASERDLLVSAQTGSGKTVAFGLAIAPTLLGDAERFERAGAPLALSSRRRASWPCRSQRELDWLYAETGARVVTCVGGMDARRERARSPRRAHRRRHARAACATISSAARSTSRELRAVVLDEADEMLDLGFREDLEFILDADARQSAARCCSRPPCRATSPRWPSSYQRDALRIEAPAATSGMPTSSTARCASRRTTRARRRQRAALLRGPRAIVFCNTREAVQPSAGDAARARLLGRGAVGRADPERAHPRAAGAARRPRPRLRRDRRRRARPRPARLSASSSTPTCRNDPRDAAAPLRPHRPRRPQGRLRLLIPPAAASAPNC